MGAYAEQSVRATRIFNVVSEDCSVLFFMCFLLEEISWKANYVHVLIVVGLDIKPN
jgi:hypothetical protein